MLRRVTGCCSWAARRLLHRKLALRRGPGHYDQGTPAQRALAARCASPLLQEAAPRGTAETGPAALKPGPRPACARPATQARPWSGLMTISAHLAIGVVVRRVVPAGLRAWSGAADASRAASDHNRLPVVDRVMLARRTLSPGAAARAARGAERWQKSRKLIGIVAIWGHSTD